jgi:carbamoyl-phosphate synthase large subunit
VCFTGIEFMTKKRLTVLVLGVGGNVSQGILKALACSSLDCRVIGACTSAAAFGLYAADAARVSPPASSPQFADWLIDVCKEESVDAVLSGVEPVLNAMVLHQQIIREKSGAICVVNDPHAMKIGSDKQATSDWLRENDMPYPETVSGDDCEPVLSLAQKHGYPLIAKPRAGKGSQGIHILRDDAQVRSMLPLPGHVVQQMLGDDESEYTAACLTDREDRLRGMIVFRRLLTSGTTSCAIAGEFPEVRETVSEIIAKLKPRGPCNVQLRMHRGRAVCFEINVRFSGTTPIRARLGFNDVEAAIRHYVLGEDAVDLPLVTSGQALRYWNEAYISPEAFTELQRSDRLASPGDHAFSIETFGTRA